MKAHNGIGISHIDPPGIIAMRVKRNAKRQSQAGSKYFTTTHFVAVGRRPQYSNSPGRTLGNENVAVRCDTNEPWLIQPTRKKLNTEPRRYVQLSVSRLSNT